ncbi:RecQ family ATP-dependent DNA helicase [Limibacter armeniacum]|uniref:RecQ family ATP-dependent DNA helicase n=1 Tax=Limibacter armeniacum TaxID=466084 RepID=UPI002FE55D81
MSENKKATALALEKYFSFTHFRDGQEEVIDRIVSGESATAIFPTGSGKSLCYQLSAVLLPHLTVVVSPLLALIQDQMDFLKRKGIPAARIDSTLTPDEANQIANGLKAGEYKILFISVERFKNERFRTFLHSLKLSMLVVDEAHCISEWGHNFRPDYLKLPQYRQDFNIPQVLLLTATATPKVVADMCKKFGFPPENVTVTGFYRPNLHISIEPTSHQEKLAKLATLLSAKKEESSIVYVTLQQTANDVANYLVDQGVVAEAYHAGMKPDDRKAIQDRFMSGKSKVIVATIAFGMGIDKQDIRNVIHFDLPKSIENYSQEIGRAGRDGNDSECIVLASRDNLNVLENFVFGDTPELESIQKVLEGIKASGDRWEMQLYQLSNDSNIRQLPLKTLLVYLESLGVIQPMYSYYAEYRFKELIPRESIIGKFEGERQKFIWNVFSHSPKAKLWSAVDMEKLLNEEKYDRKRVISALEYFDSKGWVKLEAKKMTEVFRVLKQDFDPESTAKELHQLFVNKETGEIDRLHHMVEMLESDHCLTKSLSEYFGEETDWANCGHCSVCQTGKVTLPEAQELPSLGSMDAGEIIGNVEKVLNKVPAARTVALFLCGISNPKFSRIRNRQKSGFGLLESYPFKQVEDWVEQHLNQ